MNAQIALAAELLTRYAGQPCYVALGTLDGLTAAEISAVCDAGQNATTAAEKIAAVLAGASDRRSAAAAVEARQRDTNLRRSALALGILQTIGGHSADESARIVKELERAEHGGEDLQQLGLCETQQEVADLLQAIAETAAPAAPASNPEPPAAASA